MKTGAAPALLCLLGALGCGASPMSPLAPVRPSSTAVTLVNAAPYWPANGTTVIAGQSVILLVQNSTSSAGPVTLTFQLAPNSDFSSGVIERQVSQPPGSNTSLTLDALPAGEYHWRVRAASAGSQTGFSESMWFTVTVPTFTLTLRIADDCPPAADQTPRRDFPVDGVIASTGGSSRFTVLQQQGTAEKLALDYTQSGDVVSGQLSGNGVAVLSAYWYFDILAFNEKADTGGGTGSAAVSGRARPNGRFGGQWSGCFAQYNPSGDGGGCSPARHSWTLVPSTTAPGSVTPGSLRAGR